MYAPYLERMLRRLRLHYVNPSLDFVGTRPGDFFVHPLDSHPNAGAHRRFADSIGRYVEEHRLLSPDGRSGRGKLPASSTSTDS